MKSRMAKVTEPLRATSSGDTFGPWLTAESAARYLDFRGKDPVHAFRQFARRQGIPCAYRGDRPLYARRDLDRAIGAAHRVGESR